MTATQDPPAAAPADGLAVRRAGAADAAAWDRYVGMRDEASFFHRHAWIATVERTFGHEAHHLVAERAGRIVGILPLSHKRSRLFGDALISSAFASYGGVVADDPDAARALDARAMALAGDLGVPHLELRNLTPRRDDWVRRDQTYVTFRKPLPADEAAILKGISSKGRRHDVKRSLKGGLRLEIHDDVDAFYPVLAESYRNLGTPMFPKRWFANLLDAFRDSFDVAVVVGPDGPLAASMVFRHKGDVHPYYTGGTRQARAAFANDFLFLKTMVRGIEAGATVYDFGRSKRGTGSFDYKCHWGFAPTPLVYEFHMVAGGAPPDLNPLNPKFHLMVETWKRLPLWLANRVGPFVVGQVG
jgi:FemAB-related protein (PEP-CTERM system-associated)